MTGRDQSENTITTKDDTQIYYKDWGSGQPVVFSHGWPLSGDAWEDQMMFLGAHGYRCIRGAEPSVDQSRCGLEGQELPRRGLYVYYALSGVSSDSRGTRRDLEHRARSGGSPPRAPRRRRR